MTCQFCGADRVGAKERCASCAGTPVAPAVAAPSIRCPKCRAAVDKGEKFCAA